MSGACAQAALSVRMLSCVCVAAIGLLACGDPSTHDASGAEDSAARADGASAPALQPVPEFDLQKLGGGRVRTADLAGKIVVIDFWATWCPPCEFQVPELNAFYEAHRDEVDIAVYGISVDTAGDEVVAQWASEKDVRYPILLGGDPVARRVGALGFPTLLVITPAGEIDAQHVGLIERATLEDAIARLRSDAARAAKSAHTEEGRTPAPRGS